MSNGLGINGVEIKVGELLEELRAKKPIIHHITNYVTVNDCANAVLAIGASPIMADDSDEVEDMVGISGALVLNMGTLNERTIESMLRAGKKANQLGIPVVFDPVGAGASTLRNRTAERILSEVRLSVLRGNMSEIGFLSGLDTVTKGVDVSEADLQRGEGTGKAIARDLARKLNCTVGITGAVDLISDGERVIMIENGHIALAKVTGTGCMTSSLVGAFSAVGGDYLLAAAAGILCMGIAGEVAYAKAGHLGSGSFHIGIIDAISCLDGDTIRQKAKIYMD